MPPPNAARCSICRCAEPSPQMGGLCTPCADTHHPPIEARRRWLSPLAIAALSLADVFLLVPGLVAAALALSELKNVREREAWGLRRPEHSQVRTQSVWAIAIGAGRPVLLAAFVLSFALTPLLRHPRSEPAPPFDELGEVLADLRSGDARRENVALRQLPHVLHGAADPGPSARALEAVLALDHAELRVRAARAALDRQGAPWSPRIDALTLALHADTPAHLRAELVRLLAGLRRLQTLEVALHLHAADQAPLAVLPDDAAVNAVMLRLPNGNPYRALGAERFAARCGPGDRASPEVQRDFEAAVVYSLDGVAAAPVEDRVRRLQHAVAVAPGLACLSTMSALSRLEAAARSDESRVAVAAILALRVPERHASRLNAALADPMARAYWHRHAGRIPPGFRTRDAVSIAEGAAALEQAGHRCESPARQRLQHYPGVSEVAHRWECADGFDRVTYSAPLGSRTARWRELCATSLLGFQKPQRAARIMFWPPSATCAGSPHRMPPRPDDPIVDQIRCDSDVGR